MARLLELGIPMVQARELGKGFRGLHVDEAREAERRHGVIVAEVQPSENGLWVLTDSGRLKHAAFGVEHPNEHEIVALASMETYIQKGLPEGTGVASLLVTNNTLRHHTLVESLLGADDVTGYIGMGGEDPININGVRLRIKPSEGGKLHGRPDPMRDILTGRLIHAVDQYNRRALTAHGEIVPLKFEDITCRTFEAKHLHDVSEATSHHQSKAGLVDEVIRFSQAPVEIFPTPPRGDHITRSFHHLYIEAISDPNTHVIARSAWDGSAAVAVQVHDGQVISIQKQNHSEKLDEDDPINAYNRLAWQTHMDRYYRPSPRRTVVDFGRGRRAA